jgi:AcrR family transcriptional regulator
MVTRRKAVKLRDRERTMQELIDAVGSILQDEGYAGLNLTRIAARTGKDRKLIRDYFLSLNNLLKAYIGQRDYWPPFFQKYRLPEKPAEEDVLRLFVDMMQENLRKFRSDPEMQKIILWQISQESPLMRNISEERERDGEKLLSLTDPFLKDSDVDFRAVVALILGGTYYMVLHGGTNKSRVSGMDVMLEKDYRVMLRTIEQVLEWAWSAGGERRARGK